MTKRSKLRNCKMTAMAKSKINGIETLDIGNSKLARFNLPVLRRKRKSFCFDRVAGHAGCSSGLVRLGARPLCKSRIRASCGCVRDRECSARMLLVPGASAGRSGAHTSTITKCCSLCGGDRGVMSSCQAGLPLAGRDHCYCTSAAVSAPAMARRGLHQ